MSTTSTIDFNNGEFAPASGEYEDLECSGCGKKASIDQFRAIKESGLYKEHVEGDPTDELPDDIIRQLNDVREEED